VPFPRVVPDSDGWGVIDAVGEGVEPSRVGECLGLWQAVVRCVRNGRAPSRLLSYRLALVTSSVRAWVSPG
jgi:NADPH:quinone reductase-like Zn-dependent oxidoreductase